MHMQMHDDTNARISTVRTYYSNPIT